jgi:hypothetical protein
VAQKNDEIFQLSLTELAFTICFILLLLLGYLIGKEQHDRKEAEDALEKALESSTQAISERDTAKKSLVTLLESVGTPNQDEAITKLIAAEELRAERDRLKQRIEDLDTQLTALTELKSQLEKVVQSSMPNIAQEVESALAFQRQIKKAIEVEAAKDASSNVGKNQQDKATLERVKHAIATTGELTKQLKAELDRELKQGQESQTVHDVIAAAKSYGDLVNSGGTLKKENTDLRGQIVFLKNKLEARGGRDYPPCWADEKTGKVEFLFSIEVKPDNVTVLPVWPPSREEDARALPGLAEILSGSPHSNANFVNSMRGIHNKSQELQCRHYVQLKSSIADAVQSDRARLMVENIFYKVEIRR